MIMIQIIKEQKSTLMSEIMATIKYGGMSGGNLNGIIE